MCVCTLSAPHLTIITCVLPGLALQECVEWEKPEVVAKPSLFPTLVAAAEDNKLSTFIAAIKAADLTSTVSDPETTWTVFAPTGEKRRAV
jgi:hypothetical protein